MDEVRRQSDGLQKAAEQDPPVSAQYLKPRYAGLFFWIFSLLRPAGAPARALRYDGGGSGASMLPAHMGGFYDR